MLPPAAINAAVPRPRSDVGRPLAPCVKRSNHCSSSVHIAGLFCATRPSTKLVPSQPLYVSIVLLACAPAHAQGILGQGILGEGILGQGILGEGILVKGY